MTAIETRSSECRVASWVLSLEYSQYTNPSEKPKLHKLSPGLPYYDTKPPPGLTVVKIEVVHVKMLLAPTLNASNRKSVLSEILDHTPEGELDADMLFCANDTLDDTWSSLLFDNPDEIGCDDPQTYFTTQQDQDVTSNVGTQGTELQTSDAPTPHEWSPYLTPPSSREVFEQSQNEPKSAASEAQHMSTIDVLQVVETGLKYVTMKSPTRKLKFGAVSSNEGFKSLSSIAPALWVPDYHRSVSSRAVLIPTIGHGIAKVSSRASTNAGLSEKVQHLARQQSCTNDQAAPGDLHVCARELQKTISIQVWQGMTSNLSLTAIARKLQPFSDLAEPNDNAAYGSMEDMLDENTTDLESCGSCDESDFEDLHDTLSELDEEATGEMDDLNDLGCMQSGWTGETEDCLLDYWDSRDFSPSEVESEMLGEDLVIEESELCSGVEPGDGSNFVSCHQETMLWDGLDPASDLINADFREIETVGFDMEYLLPMLRS